MIPWVRYTDVVFCFDDGGIWLLDGLLIGFNWSTPVFALSLRGFSVNRHVFVLDEHRLRSRINSFLYFGMERYLASLGNYFNRSNTIRDTESGSNRKLQCKHGVFRPIQPHHPSLSPFDQTF